MKIKLNLDRDTAQKLVQCAVSDRRPVSWQAEILLRRALSSPFPNEREATQQHVATPVCEVRDE